MNEKKAIALLKKYATSKEKFKKILSHSRKVQEIALRIAKKIHGIDLEFIKIGSLLHDIGRFDCWNDPLHHGIRGAEILRKEGLERYALLAERHLGAGITKEEIKHRGLDLPLRDFVPVTPEEKIITYADNLVQHDKEITFKESIERFKKELGTNAIKKFYKLKREVDALHDKG